MRNIGVIKQEAIRNIWQHEERNFTPWLAEDGLQLLGDAVGLELKNTETEYSVGRYELDILAEEASTGRLVAIENQYGKTNHDHLGKLITYAAGVGASYAIWVVENPGEEHQKAIEWLNNNTDMDLGFS